MNALRTFIRRDVKSAIEDPFTTFVLIPSVGGSALGSIYGGYKGFMVTRKDEYGFNVLGTFYGIISGGSVGFVMGSAWPLSFVVAGMRLVTSDPGNK